MNAVPHEAVSVFTEMTFEFDMIDMLWLVFREVMQSVGSYRKLKCVCVCVSVGALCVWRAYGGTH